MKRGTCIGLIVGGAAFLIGVICLGFSGGLKSGVVPSSQRSDAEWTAVGETVRSIQLMDQNNAIVIEKDPTLREISVRYTDTDEGNYFTSVTKDGTLVVEYRRNGAWFERAFFNFGDFRKPLTVYVPDTAYDAISVKTSNGRISAEGLTADSIVLDTDNASVTASALAATDEISIKSSNGSVELASSKSAGTIEIKTNNARVELSSVATGTGLKVKTNNGDIRFDAIDTDAGEILLDTGNASISGRLASPSDAYTIKSHTSNAKNNLPENWGKGDKRLSVTTSNGRIDVSFAD